MAPATRLFHLCPLSPPSPPSLMTCVSSHFFDSVVLPRVRRVALTSLLDFCACTRRSARPVEVFLRQKHSRGLMWKAEIPRPFPGDWVPAGLGKGPESLVFFLWSSVHPWPGKLGNHCLGRCLVYRLLASLLGPQLTIIPSSVIFTVNSF